MAFISNPGIVTTCFLIRKIAHFTARHRPDLIAVCQEFLPADVATFTGYLDTLQTMLTLISQLCDLWEASRPE